MPDDELERAWRCGKWALDAARERLRCLDGTDLEVVDRRRRILVDLESGDLASALAGCRGADPGDLPDEIGADITIALQQRNRVVEIAARTYGPSLHGIARRYDGKQDAEDDLARAWVKITRKIYDWRGEGPFGAWLRAAARRVLIDGARSARRAVARRGDAPTARLAALDGTDGPAADQGTMTAWVAVALRGFRDSLDSERQTVWDGWERLGGEGLRPEEIYRSLAQSLGKTVSAIKMTIHRLEAEFRELIGADRRGIVDASRIVALWVGSERRGSETAVLVTGIDVQDRMRLLAVRQVSGVDARTFMQIFWALRRWGLPRTRRILVVADDSEGLRDALITAFPGDAIVQPCVEAFIASLTRQVAAELPALPRLLRKAFALRSAKEARQRLIAVADSLASRHPDASWRLRGEIDALLTVKSLELPSALEEQLTRVAFFADDERRGRFAWASDSFRRLRLHRSLPRRQEALAALIQRFAVGVALDQDAT